MNKYNLKQLIKEEINKILEDQSSTTGDENLFDDIPAVDMHIDDNGFMSINIQSMFHSPDNGKIAILLKNPQIRDAVVYSLQREAQKLFRKTIHGLAGEPFNLS
jgi:flagellar basal body-associated protein FliL